MLSKRVIDASPLKLTNMQVNKKNIMSEITQAQNPDL